MSNLAASSKPTRERILDSALKLFADRGYEATSIGEIESAAGLVPRSGALYKHFPSKRALIDAALAERFGAMDSIDARLELMPQGDLNSELVFVARLSLGELESERDLCRLVMKDGDRFPELAQSFHTGIVERGHRIAVAWLRLRAESLGRELDDVEALAQVLTDALVGYVLQHHMFGPNAAAVDRERVIAAWVAIARSQLQPASESNEPEEER
ncbi:MAG: TetR/AcrR family transcriptional regulator [Solirubrobacterales bacterium]|nr:TetR/AcrR family transcriptional regulator [Solirubrobacterales bacterium]